jgi:hypothetical protein
MSQIIVDGKVIDPKVMGDKLSPGIKPKDVKKTKVAILGFAPSWAKTPWDDLSMEVWAINGLYTYLDQVPNSHAERWFDMHREHEIVKQDDDDTHVKRLKELVKKGVKLYTCEPMKDFPEAIVYPLEEIEKMVGRSYWTNTISYLVAYAVYLKKIGEMPDLNEIHVYGVDMAQDGEFQFQRPSVEFIIGWAIGEGIKVVLPQESDILRSIYKYGYDNCPLETKIFSDKKDEHQKQFDAMQTERTKLINWRNGKMAEIEAEFNNKINQIDAYLNQIRGAMDMSEYFRRVVFAQRGGVPFSPSVAKDNPGEFPIEVKEG